MIQFFFVSQGEIVSFHDDCFLIKKYILLVFPCTVLITSFHCAKKKANTLLYPVDFILESDRRLVGPCH